MSRKFLELDFLVEKLREIDNGNNHILITGDIKVGKTTLLNAFIKKYYSDKICDGVITELIITDKFRILLNRLGSSEKTVIGESSENGMIFFDDIFLEKSFEIFSHFNNDIDIVILDEIGNKEKHLLNYTEKLLSIFNGYRVFAVLKKSGNPIFENLEKIGDYSIFDLDKMYE